MMKNSRASLVVAFLVLSLGPATGGVGQDLVASFRGLAKLRASPGSAVERPTVVAAEPSLNPDRILVVIGCSTQQCLQFEISFNKLRTRLESDGWTVGTEATNQMQVLDIRDPSQADLVDQYLDASDPQEMPVIVKLEGGKVVRQIKRGCGTTFDRWSAWWLFTGMRAPTIPERDRKSLSKRPEDIRFVEDGGRTVTATCGVIC